MDKPTEVPDKAPEWFKLWAAKYNAERAEYNEKRAIEESGHTGRFWGTVVAFGLGNVAILVGAGLWLGSRPTKADFQTLNSRVEGLATKADLQTLNSRVDGLATKADLQKEIRTLRKELLENDVDILGFVLEAHGDKKIRAAIEKKIGKMQEKIEILEKSLAENQPESPEHFQVVTGTIENYNPATALVEVRSDDSLIKGKMPLIPMAARLFGSSGLTEVPLGTEHKGWEASFVLVRGEIGEPKIIRKVILFEPKP